MTENQKQELEDLALRVREHIIRMATDGGCFIGASLSCADLIVYLYKQVLNIGPEKTGDPGRDYLLLSKGHDVPALYGTLAELGFIDAKRLANHLKPNDHIYWHPNREIPGIEFHSGSLGHLLSVAIGIALDIKMRRAANRVFVITGDGELNEGSMWEAILIGSARKLHNLIVIVDRNGFQANFPTEELIPLEPLEKKFESFGWLARRVDGHSFSELEKAFTNLPESGGQPCAIIADTVRGKGLPSIEKRADRWFVNFTHDEITMLLDELHSIRAAQLTSKPIVAR